MLNNNQLPDSFRSYFWDVKFEDIDMQKNPQFVLKRIIDRGNTDALLWILERFSTDDVKNLILTSRDLSRRTANFWAEILGLNKSNVPCLQKPYSPRKIESLTAQYLNSLVNY